MFDERVIVALVAEFCRRRGVDQMCRIRFVPNLRTAFEIVALKGPDERWRNIVARPCDGDLPDVADDYGPAAADRSAYEHELQSYDRQQLSALAKRKRWWLNHIVVSGNHWARTSQTMRAARDLGLGWIVPASRDLLIVSRPRLRCLEERPDVLHNDTGLMAIEWQDGSGAYFLRGTAFDSALYFDVVDGRLTLEQVASLPSADQRSVALSYLRFEQLLSSSHARLLDSGEKGTTLYRLSLPDAIARDRVRGYGRYDYFIHMRDASHPEREFIEWVHPRIGAIGDAELCQAHAFGITRDEWLSISQEG